MKNLLIVTGSRSEYGLLRNLILKIKHSKKIKSFLAVTGTHLSTKYGSTLTEINKDNLKIDLKLFLKYSKNEKENLKKNSFKILKKISEILLKKKIDLCVLIGDRYEAFITAVSCVLSDVKIAHIHGGELSEGSKDDIFRHSISKMSNLHFVATQTYKKRILQLGEDPRFVFNVGALCNDTIERIKFLNKHKFLKKNNLKFDKTLLICCHPEISKEQNKILVNNLLKNLKKLKKINIIFTYPNSDPGSEYIIEKFKKFTKNNKNSRLYKSLGHETFLQFLKNSEAIIGNSSSGIIEAPILNTPTLNIGQRQKGRLMSSSVVNCSIKNNQIKNAIKKILINKKMKKQKCEYKSKNVSNKILDIIERIDMRYLTLKKFNDVEFKKNIFS